MAFFCDTVSNSWGRFLYTTHVTRLEKGNEGGGKGAVRVAARLLEVISTLT